MYVIMCIQYVYGSVAVNTINELNWNNYLDKICIHNVYLILDCFKTRYSWLSLKFSYCFLQCVSKIKQSVDLFYLCCELKHIRNIVWIKVVLCCWYVLFALWCICWVYLSNKYTSNYQACPVMIFVSETFNIYHNEKHITRIKIAGFIENDNL